MSAPNECFDYNDLDTLYKHVQDLEANTKLFIQRPGQDAELSIKEIKGDGRFNGFKLIRGAYSNSSVPRDPCRFTISREGTGKGH